MPSHADLTTLARLETQRLLSAMPTFHGMSHAEQLAIYKHMVERKLDDLVEQTAPPNGHSRSRAMAAPPPEPQKASDAIDPTRGQNKRIDQAGQLAGDFITDVNFPKFVADLLKGVFDANLDLTLKQMSAYQTLLQTATQSLATFVNKIKPAEAYAYLAEKDGDNFSIDFDDEKKDASGAPSAVLVDKSGEKVDLGDNEIKAKIMDASLAMAKEQRALLRESILMGLARIVIRKGVLKASVLFDIKAAEKIDVNDKAAMKAAHSSGGGGGFSSGLIGSIFGGVSGGGSTSDKKTTITVSSAKGSSTTSLQASLAGSVEIEFFTDFFKLDNFKDMYAPGAESGGQKALPAAAPVAAVKR